MDCFKRAPWVIRPTMKVMITLTTEVFYFQQFLIMKIGANIASLTEGISRTVMLRKHVDMGSWTLKAPLVLSTMPFYDVSFI